MKKRSIVTGNGSLMAVAACDRMCGQGSQQRRHIHTKGQPLTGSLHPVPGGGSDIYTRMISDIMTKENLVNGQTIIVTNKTDGSGEIGRNEVATTKGKQG